MMSDQEIFYTIALTRMTGFNAQQALQLYMTVGGGQAVYDYRNEIIDRVSGCTQRLAEALRNWDDALERAAAEMEFITKHQVQALTLNDERYPARLRECSDAPIIVYYKGNADLNKRRVVSIVGTRRSTAYGHDLTRHFISRLHELCPDVLVVSGLAYGIDICAHREALTTGYETIGVLAHGLDQIYPPRHRETAVSMINQGGLLTEYMTQTEPFANNFRQRNRIVAGMADATLVVESASKGGALITARIAQDYGRDVLAFPGPIGAPYSEGCNQLIRDNKAGLITSADDFVEAVGWQTDIQRLKAENDGIERELFPDLSAEEHSIVDLLKNNNDLQLNILSVKSNIPIGQLTALLFQLEMKGIIRPLAGGIYHLIM
jgi:DNA processing protein